LKAGVQSPALSKVELRHIAGRAALKRVAKD